MAGQLSFATLKAIIDVVQRDADCRSHITWNQGKYPWAGAVRNTVMQTQGRLDRFGSDGDVPQLLWGDVNISHWREKYVCVGIAQWTSIAINKALRSRQSPELSRTVDFAGPVSCRAFPHMGTGIRLKSGLSGVKRDPVYASHPMLQYHDDAKKQLAALAACDFVVDWWYKLDIAAPWVFSSQSDFENYVGGVDAGGYLSSPAATRPGAPRRPGMTPVAS